MDFVNKAYAQSKDLFLSMTPGTRMVAGLLVAAIVISLFYLFQTNLTGSEEFMFGARVFSLEELQSIQEAFAKANLGDYEVDENRIKVPHGKKNEYVGAMIEHDALPRLTNDFWRAALTGSNPFESRETQQARLKHAKENELALWIRGMKGIEWASVQYDIQEERGFPRKKLATAIVAVRSEGGAELDPRHVKGIRNTVAGSLAELKSENVTVQDLNGRSYDPDTESAIFGADGTGYAAVKQHYESLWRDKVRDAVSYIPGVTVVANVELDMETRRIERGYPLNSNRGTSRAGDLNAISRSSSPTSHCRSGLLAQAGAIISGGSVSREGSQFRTVDREPVVEKITTDRDEYTTGKTPWVPKRVTVAVNIPSSYYRDVWKQRNPARDSRPAPEPTDIDLKNVEDEVTKKVEDVAVGLLPKPVEDLKDAYPRVRVTTYQSLAVAETPVPTTTDKAITWLGDNWSKLGLGLVGLFGLVMLRSVIRSVPADPASQAPAAAAAFSADRPQGMPKATAENEPELPPRTQPESFGDSDQSIKDELADMIRGNPDAAAAILKNWISNAA